MRVRIPSVVPKLKESTKMKKEQKPKKGYTLPIGPNEPSVWGKLATLVVVIVGTVLRKIRGK